MVWLAFLFFFSAPICFQPLCAGMTCWGNNQLCMIGHWPLSFSTLPHCCPPVGSYFVTAYLRLDMHHLWCLSLVTVYLRLDAHRLWCNNPLSLPTRGLTCTAHGVYPSSLSTQVLMCTACGVSTLCLHLLEA